MTPELYAAVGEIVVAWALVESEVNFWAMPICFIQNRKIPTQFSAVTDLIWKHGKALYPRHPEMPAKLRAFLDTLVDAHAARTSVCHGVPSTITHRGRTYPGLAIPPAGKKEHRYPEMSIEDMRGWAEKIWRNRDEVSAWSTELHRAEQRLRPTESHWHNGRMVLTAELYPEPDPSL